MLLFLTILCIQERLEEYDKAYESCSKAIELNLIMAKPTLIELI